MSKDFERAMKKEYDDIFYGSGTEEEQEAYRLKAKYYSQIASDIEERVIKPYCDLLSEEIKVGYKDVQTSVIKSCIWAAFTAIGLVSGIWTRVNEIATSNLLLGVAGASAVGAGFAMADTAISGHGAGKKELSRDEVLQEWQTLKQYPKFIQEFMKANRISEGPYSEGYKVAEIELPEGRIKELIMPSSLWQAVESE